MSRWQLARINATVLTTQEDDGSKSMTLPRKYSVPEAAKVWEVGEALAWRGVWDESIKSVRFGSRVFVLESEVQRIAECGFAATRLARRKKVNECEAAVSA